MAEVPGSVFVVDLGCQESDASTQLGCAVDELVAGVGECDDVLELLPSRRKGLSWAPRWVTLA